MNTCCMNMAEYRVLKFIIENKKGILKNSTFNSIKNVPIPTKRDDRKSFIESMVNKGWFTVSKPNQVYIYTVTEKGIATFERFGNQLTESERQ